VEHPAGQTRGAIGGGSAGEPDNPIEAAPTLALIVRFYHIDPERILNLPRWVVQLLVEQMPAIEAIEAQAAITAASAPHLTDRAFGRLLRRLERQAQPFMSEPEKPAPEIIEVNPEKAAEWFAAQGLVVVQASE
jgi:hypothetical protein